MSDFGLFLLLCAGLLLVLGLIRFLAWLTELQNEHGSLGRAGLNTVKRYVAPTPRVMSRSNNAPAPSIPSSLETDGVQTRDQTNEAAARRLKLLDTYKPLRKLGMSRDDARAFLHRLDIPLDNNLWAEAAPAADDAPHVTPIVGRPTSAKFETDPDYPYQSPA